MWLYCRFKTQASKHLTLIYVRVLQSIYGDPGKVILFLVNSFDHKFMFRVFKCKNMESHLLREAFLLEANYMFYDAFKFWQSHTV